MKKLIFFCSIYLTAVAGWAQDGVGINTDNPDPSAILDVESTTQGVLVPRMTTTQMNNISSPALGLLVYNTTRNTFWYYNGSGWEELESSVSTDQIQDSDGDTRVEVEQTADDDLIRFISRGREYFQMDEGHFNVFNTGNSVFMGNLAGRVDDLSDNRNVFIGNSAGQFNTFGQNNVAVGYRALRANVDGADNVAIGKDAVRRMTTGSNNIGIGSNVMSNITTSNNNTSIGYNSLLSLTSGEGNTVIGSAAMQTTTSGSYNVALGEGVLFNNRTGSRNTAIGRQAGYNSNGSGNVFIGYEAGYSATGDDLLFIDNSNTATPLIWGDFGEDSLIVNGDLSVTGNITYVGTITDVSDRRLKEDFDTLTQVMSLVNQLQAYSYKMKSNEKNEREFGLIAQEVQKVFPEMVKVIDQEKGYIGVNYLQLVSILVEGLKEQQALLNNFEGRHEESQQKLNELKAQVENIKTSLNLR